MRAFIDYVGGQPNTALRLGAMVLESTTNRVILFDDSVTGGPAYML